MAIAEMRKPDEALLRQFLKGFLAKSPDAVILFSPFWEVTDWSAAAESLFGWTHAEVVDAGERTAVPLKFIDPLGGIELRPLSDHDLRMEATLGRKDGSALRAEITCYAIRGGQDRLLGYAVIVRDLTIPSLASFCVRAVASSSTLEDAVTSLGGTIDEVLGLTSIVLCIPEENAFTIVEMRCGSERARTRSIEELGEGPIREALQKRQPVVTEMGREGTAPLDTPVSQTAHVAIPLFSGEEIFAVLAVGTSGRVQDAVRNRDALISIARTIEESFHLLLLGDRQRSAVATLIEMDHRKSEYLAMISHEMRSPLAVIAGLGQVWSQKHDSLGGAELERTADAIVRSAKRIANLLDEGHDLTLIESGRLPLAIKPFDLVGLIKSTVSDLSEPLDARPIGVDIEPGIPMVMGDENRNWQILTNLLTNAAKFGNGSPVRLAVRRMNGEVLVSVRDEGPGISPQDFPAVFEKFGRVGDAEADGMGLGLFIARSLVETQGGRIWVDSAAGKGSTFTYSLPVAE